jgi:hypothetical protein
LEFDTGLAGAAEFEPAGALLDVVGIVSALGASGTVVIALSGFKR